MTCSAHSCCLPHMYAIDQVINIGVCLYCWGQKGFISQTLTMTVTCKMHVDQDMYAHPKFAHILSLNFDIMQVGRGLQICGSQPTWPGCTNRKFCMLQEACAWVDMMMMQCMQVLSHLLTAGRERKADATGVATMVRIKEQLNRVGNRSVPAACSQCT